MPGHSSWLTLLLDYFKDSLEEKAALLGDSLVGASAAAGVDYEWMQAFAAEGFRGLDG